MRDCARTAWQTRLKNSQEGKTKSAEMLIDVGGARLLLLADRDGMTSPHHATQGETEAEARRRRFRRLWEPVHYASARLPHGLGSYT